MESWSKEANGRRTPHDREPIHNCENMCGDIPGRSDPEDSRGQDSQGEAMRCLKRRVSDAVFKKLMADLEEVRTAV
jgi:hypothetical protein